MGLRQLSMNLRFRSAVAREQKIKIATLIGLPDMGRVHRPITARIARRRRPPGVAAAAEFLVGDMQTDAPRISVDFDLVSGAHESERSSHIALRRRVENAG